MLFQRLKKISKKNRSLRACVLSDFGHHHHHPAPNPPAVAWEIPRRQGVGGEERCGALPFLASRLCLALPSKSEFGQPRSRHSKFSPDLPAGDGGEGIMVPEMCCCCLLSIVKKCSENNLHI